MGLLLVVAVSAGAAPAPDDAAAWRALAARDVEESFALYRAQHPGMHDPEDKGFAERLDRARAQGLAMAGRLTDAAQYPAVLAAFSAELADGHAVVHPTPAFADAVAEEWRWPGFVANWRGSSMVVTRAKPDVQHLAGARVVTCDGRTVPDLVLRNLNRLGGRADEPGQWWWRAHGLFLDTPSRGLELIGAAPPQTCRFELEGGKVRRERLRWRPLEDADDAWLLESRVGTPTPTGLSMPRPGLWLVGLSDFQPDAEGRQAFETLFGELEARREELAGARAILLDLRGNNGGSSHWPTRVAELLWGEAFVKGARARHFGDVAIHWRTSADNRAYLAGMLASEGFPDAWRPFLEKLLAQWDDAVASGEPMVVQPPEPDEETPAGDAVPGLSGVPVYVAVHGGCASACNDALDTFRLAPGVRLVGAPSSADSRYMDVRAVMTESGMARIVLPMKIWVGRPPRPGPGDTYLPDVPVESADWTTDRFLDAVEADLAARARAGG
ncbi:MAG: hypothetical protein SNJ63_07630 [Sphingomonadaceae bacterium]